MGLSGCLMPQVPRNCLVREFVLLSEVSSFISDNMTHCVLGFEQASGKYVVCGLGGESPPAINDALHGHHHCQWLQ